MTTNSSISFKVIVKRPTEIIPVIDGIELIDLVGKFEKSKHYEPAGGYGGIVPEYFRYGPLRQYFLGQSKDDYWRENGGIYVLGCDCGEVGCWPLVCKSTSNEDLVIWSEFKQPHRTEWDYSNFGPFQFERSAFDDAARLMLEKVGLPY